MKNFKTSELAPHVRHRVFNKVDFVRFSWNQIIQELQAWQQLKTNTALAFGV